jgi:hypothetical protein
MLAYPSGDRHRQCGICVNTFSFPSAVVDMFKLPPLIQISVHFIFSVSQRVEKSVVPEVDLSLSA